jgi:hypothetical protein
MKKLLIAVIFLIISARAVSQTADNQEKVKEHQTPPDSIKKGWNIGYLPAVAYDSDLGVYYGIIIEPFDYGDGKIYPNYYQKLYLQVSGYLKGSSEHLLEWRNIYFSAKYEVRRQNEIPGL